MSDAMVGLCEVEFYLPGITSLKEKRGIIKSMLARARHTFNVAAAEVAHQEAWQSATLAFTTVSNSAAHTRDMLNSLLRWLEVNFPEALITRHHIDIL